MKAFSIEYTYNGYTYRASVDARDRESARNKVGRKHGLNAADSKKKIKIKNATVVGFF